MMNSKSDLPEKQSAGEKAQVEILGLSSEIYPDQRRVKVNFRLSEFQTNPNAALRLVSPDGELLASVNIVNIFSPVNEITLHIPARRNIPGEYRIEMDLFYVVEEPSPGGELDRVIIKTIPINSASTAFSLQ